jgi:hypothetical protein
LQVLVTNNQIYHGSERFLGNIYPANLSLLTYSALAAVLQPGSLEWWRFLDDRGIDGDPLLGDPESITTSARRLFQAEQEVVAGGEGPHWEAARILLAQYRPMKDASCPLFARKFSATGADHVAHLAKGFASFPNSLGMASETQRRH